MFGNKVQKMVKELGKAVENMGIYHLTAQQIAEYAQEAVEKHIDAERAAHYIWTVVEKERESAQCYGAKSGTTRPNNGKRMTYNY